MLPSEAVDFVRKKYARIQAIPAPPKSRKVQYAEYLASQIWRAKADRVMARAKGICEGCLLRKAREVHHLTYTHIFHEFMFELVALCAECHDRWHEKAKK